MKTIHIVSWVDLQNGGDYEAAFDCQILLDAWHIGECGWHGELFDTFLEKVGLTIAYREPSDSDAAAIRAHFDIDEP